jgi:AraC-like DNA-binding protein
MIFARHVPPTPLNAYIDDIYYIDGPTPYPRPKVLPMPSLHLIVNLGDALNVYKPDQTEVLATCAESGLGGLWSRYHLIDCPVHIRIFGVQFKPYGAYPFLHFPLSELHDQIVPLDAIWGDSTAEIRERLYAAPTIQAGFTLLEQLLLSRLGEFPYHLDIVQAAISEIARQHGALSIRALSDALSISHNHLDSLFKRMVGISPKVFARFHRFAHALRSIDRTQSVNWTRIAHDAGYYDQSHFNKDFGTLTGYSPTDYLRERCAIYVKSPEQTPERGTDANCVNFYKSLNLCRNTLSSSERMGAQAYRLCSHSTRSLP